MDSVHTSTGCGRHLWDTRDELLLLHGATGLLCVPDEGREHRDDDDDEDEEDEGVLAQQRLVERLTVDTLLTPQSSPTPQLGGGEVPNRVLWVGNLDRDVREADLRALFAPFGTVEGVRVLGRKRCGFVTYGDVASAAVARGAVDGQTLCGRTVHVHFGRHQQQQQQQRQQHEEEAKRQVPGARGAQRREEKREQRAWSAHALSVVDDGGAAAAATVFGCSRAVWVGNVGDDVTDDEFVAFVAQFGKVETTKLLRQKRCGFANYCRAADADRAVRDMAGLRLGSSAIKGNFAQPRAAHRRRRRHRKTGATDAAQGQCHRCAQCTQTITCTPCGHAVCERCWSETAHDACPACLHPIHGFAAHFPHTRAFLFLSFTVTFLSRPELRRRQSC